MKKSTQNIKAYLKGFKIPSLFLLITFITYFGLSYFNIEYRFIVGVEFVIISCYLFYLFMLTEKIDIYSKPLRIMLFFIIGSPILIYGISLIASSASTFLNLPKSANSETWITFAGSILGGAMTLLAVIFNLNYERVKSKKDKALSLLPTIEVSHEYVGRNKELVDEHDELETKIKDIEETYGTSAIVLIKPITSIYSIKNTSKNIIRDLKIVNAKIIIENNEYKLYPIYKNEIPNIILENQVCMFDILVNAIINNIKDNPIVNTKNYFDFKIIVQIEYYDINKTLNIPYKHNFISEGFIDFKGDKFKDSRSNSELINSGKLEYMKDYSIGSKTSYNKLDLTIFEEKLIV